MKKRQNLEECLLYADFIRADDNYISNGHFIISKECLRSGALRLVKNTENIWADCDETVPYEQGRDFDCTSIGTECVLLPDETIGIKYNDLYYFDYEYVRMLLEQIPYWKVTTFYVVENKRNEPILKFFDENNEFLACLMSIRKKVKQCG